MRRRLYSRFNTLDGYLCSMPLHVDGILDDGWGATFPVKGREIQAAILFVDISAFSTRTLDLSPTETLIFANNFFAWITAEALQNRPGIIDKYIGDEMMVIFSKDFGSQDPFLDAIQTARRMGEYDVLSFCPHMGIAAGTVTVGYVGTPAKYNCSVYGKPVTLAQRCKNISRKGEGAISVIFPSELWQGRDFSNVFAPEQHKGSNGEMRQRPVTWRQLAPRKETVKNMPDLEVIEIVQQTLHLPQQNAEERAKEALEELKRVGRYVPHGFAFEH